MRYTYYIVLKRVIRDERFFDHQPNKFNGNILQE